jgi:hypothetical protein
MDKGIISESAEIAQTLWGLLNEIYKNINKI